MRDINREHLVAILSAAAPALGSERNILRETSMFFFDGQSVTAFDGVIGVSIEFLTDVFAGGIPGSKLLGVLQNSFSKDVTFKTIDKGETLELKAGNAKVTFAITEGDHPTWVKPNVRDFEEEEYFLDAEFR